MYFLMSCRAVSLSTRTIQGEEHRFHQTIERGLELLDRSFDTLKEQNGTQVDGKRAFELYDTFGFPLDLTQMLARERGFTVGRCRL